MLTSEMRFTSSKAVKRVTYRDRRRATGRVLKRHLACVRSTDTLNAVLRDAVKSR